MIINEIELEGFLSYIDRQKINLKNIKTVLVSGENGSGKSSLFEGFAVCWYGRKASRGRLLEELINENSHTAYIRTDIELDGIIYRRIRSWGKKKLNSLQEFRNNTYIEIAKDTDADLKGIELIGSWDLFCTVYWKQKGLLSFIEGEASSRKILLRELLDLELYQVASELASQIASDNAKELLVKKTELNQIQSIDINILKNQLTDLEKTSNDLKNTEKKIKDSIPIIEKQLSDEQIKFSKHQDNQAECQKSKDKIIECEKSIEKIRQSISQTLDKVDDINNNICAFEYSNEQSKKSIAFIQSELKMLKKYENMEIQDITLFENKLLDCNNTLSSNTNNLYRLECSKNEILVKISKSKQANGFCSILEKPCDLVSDNKYIESLNEEDTKLKQQMEDTRKVIKELGLQKVSIEKEIEKHKNENTHIANAMSKIDRLKIDIFNHESNINKNNDLLKRYEADKQKYKDEIIEYNKNTDVYKDEIKTYQDKIDAVEVFDGVALRHYQLALQSLKNQLENNQKEQIQLVEKVGGLKSQIKTIKVKQSKIKVLKNKINQIQHEKIVHEKLSFIFGKNGIQKSIMKSAVPELENSSTELIQKFCPNKNISINFELDPKTKDGELKSQGGLDIIIFENGKKKSLNLYSGGETTQITFAIYLSLAELSSQRASKSMQTLIIDERISGLDETKICRFAEIIEVIKKRYSRCIIITHITQLKDLFDKQINIVNKNGSIIVQ